MGKRDQCIVLSFIVLSFIVLSFIVLSFIVLSFIVLSFIVLSFIVLSFIVMSFPKDNAQSGMNEIVQVLKLRKVESNHRSQDRQSARYVRPSPHTYTE